MKKIIITISSILFALFIACDNSSSTEPEYSPDSSSSSVIASEAKQSSFSSSAIDSSSSSVIASEAKQSSSSEIASSSSSPRYDISSSSTIRNDSSSSSVIASEAKQSSSSEIASSSSSPRYDISSSSSPRYDISSSSTIRNDSSSSSSRYDSSSSSVIASEAKQSSSSTPSSSSEDIDVTAGSIYNATTNTLIDFRDGSIYKTVTIGEQIWMAENLKLKYNYNTAQSMCYDDNAKNCARYGRLYTWATAMDSAGIYSQNSFGCGRNVECFASGKVRGICPEGWHLPDSTELWTLLKYIGCVEAEDYANTYFCANRLKSTSGWNGEKGTDDYSFNALASGIYPSAATGFYNLGYQASFWSSSATKFAACNLTLLTTDRIYFYSSVMYEGFSVRCLKD